MENIASKITENSEKSMNQNMKKEFPDIIILKKKTSFLKRNRSRSARFNESQWR